MRKRKWALFAFISMLAFIFISLESWRLFKANEKLKDYILAEFQPIVGDQLHISKVHVSFGNIHILDVRFASPQNDISIDIRDLRIGYNFFNLLVRGFDPQYISRDALFIGPSITINKQTDALAEQKPQAASAQRYEFSSLNLKELDLFNHISIKDGEIFYAENDSVKTRIVHTVQGGIYRERYDSLFIHLDGAFYNSKTQNIQIKGHGDYRTQHIGHLKASLAEYALEDGLPVLPAHILKLNSGLLFGEIDIKWLESQKRYTTTGTVQIDNAAGHAFGDKLTLSDIGANLLVHDDKIVIQESRQRVNNSDVHITGTLEHFSNSLLDLTIESTDFELGDFSPLFTTSAHSLTGPSTVNASIRGPLNDLAIYANLRAESLKLNDVTLEHFYSKAMYNGKVLRVDSCTVDVFDNTIALSGLVELSSENNRLFGRVSGAGHGQPFTSLLELDSSVVINSTFDGILSGTLADPVVQGNANMDFRSARQDSLFLVADFHYQDKKLTLGTRPQMNGFFANAAINWQTSPPAIQAVCEKPEQMLFYVRDLPAEDFLASHVQTSLKISGNLQQFTVTGDAQTIAGGLVDSHLLHVEAKVDRQAATIQSDGEFVLYPDRPHASRGEFALHHHQNIVTVQKFDIEDQLASSLIIDLKNNMALDGSIVSNGFDMSRLRKRDDTTLAGKIDMDIKVSGYGDAPQLDGYVNAENVLFNNIGPYESLVSFHMDSSHFYLQQFQLNVGKSTLFFAQGSYDLKNNTLDFNLKSAGIDAGQIFGAAGQDSLFLGEMLIDVEVAGPANAPDVRGIVALKDGALAGIPFDEVELKLGNDAALDSVRPPSVFIDKFRLSRFNVYEVLGSGYYPFKRSDSLFLDIDGSGNFLHILNDVSPFFLSPQSVCSLHTRVRGTPNKLVLNEADLIIENANMDFRSVVPPISNVSGKIQFNADEQFLHLSTLAGTMGGRAFRIHNEPAQNIVSAKALENIHIGDSDFHFGVLILETPDKGVPLNFVGLMEPKEFGRLDLLGREKDEQFYFAGVQDGLTLRGRINLYDAELMYPFYEGARAGSPKIKEFLRNLQWDLFVVPTKNTRFVRNFPGAIDEIYVDLKLDENFGGLEITERLENDTFRINGHIRSTKGFIDYLDMNFRVERFGVDFDRSSLIPVAYGTAKTTVTDSLGISSNIVLTLQTVDNTMDKKSVDDIVRQEDGRARFNQIRFKLSSDNPNIGSSEAQVLASLGYSSNNLQNSAISAIGSGTDNLIFRPLFRPVERELEQTFGFDYVRFSSQLTKNIIMFNLNNNLELNNRLALLESTKIIVGKYLANRFFLQYTGQIESGIGYRYKEKHLGLHHTLGLEYQINPQVMVELEYVYDSLMYKNREDKRIVLRHWFPF